MTDWPSHLLTLALLAGAAVIVAIALVAPAPLKALALAYIVAP